jgi:hypothetical protein
MIRWLDFNDALAAAQGGHPSDNIGALLAVADYLSRKRKAEGRAAGGVRARAQRGEAGILQRLSHGPVAGSSPQRSPVSPAFTSVSVARRAASISRTTPPIQTARLTPPLRTRPKRTSRLDG